VSYVRFSTSPVLYTLARDGPNAFPLGSLLTFTVHFHASTGESLQCSNSHLTFSINRSVTLQHFTQRATIQLHGGVGKMKISGLLQPEERSRGYIRQHHCEQAAAGIGVIFMYSLDSAGISSQWFSWCFVYGYRWCLLQFKSPACTSCLQCGCFILLYATFTAGAPYQWWWIPPNSGQRIDKPCALDSNALTNQPMTRNECFLAWLAILSHINQTLCWSHLPE